VAIVNAARATGDTEGITYSMEANANIAGGDGKVDIQDLLAFEKILLTAP
jgi:hypothetical protein